MLLALLFIQGFPGKAILREASFYGCMESRSAACPVRPFIKPAASPDYSSQRECLPPVQSIWNWRAIFFSHQSRCRISSLLRSSSRSSLPDHLSFDHMNTKMYVGNLSFNSTEQDLRDLFGSHGEVTEVFIPTDRESGRPRGFAFVTMDSTDSMNDAISALNGNEFQGRPLVVNEAKPQANTGGGGGGGYRGNGGGRRDNNGYGRNRR